MQCPLCSARLRRAQPGAEAPMEPEAGADPDPRSHLQFGYGEPSPRRDKEDQNPIAGIRSGGRCQRLLLVPESQVQEQAQAKAPSDGETPSHLFIIFFL